MNKQDGQDRQDCFHILFILCILFLFEALHSAD